MRTCLGMNFRRSEMNTLEQISTAVAAMPIPNAFFSDVVVASVGHIPRSCTSVGFWSRIPDFSCFR